MKTIREHLEMLGNNGDKIIGYAVISSMLNIMSEGVMELEDEEVGEAIDKIQDMIEAKQDELMKMNTDDA